MLNFYYIRYISASNNNNNNIKKYGLDIRNKIIYIYIYIYIYLNGHWTKFNPLPYYGPAQY